MSRSREGAWIEITATADKIKAIKVAPARERGLKLPLLIFLNFCLVVAPARERGLKSGLMDHF